MSQHSVFLCLSSSPQYSDSKKTAWISHHEHAECSLLTSHYITSGHRSSSFEQLPPAAIWS